MRQLGHFVDHPAQEYLASCCPSRVLIPTVCAFSLLTGPFVSSGEKAKTGLIRLEGRFQRLAGFASAEPFLEDH